jgi:hypothetical protein
VTGGIRGALRETMEDRISTEAEIMVIRIMAAAVIMVDNRIMEEDSRDMAGETRIGTREDMGTWVTREDMDRKVGMEETRIMEEATREDMVEEPRIGTRADMET